MSLNTYRAERRMVDCAGFFLPMPPSTNNLFFNLKAGGRAPTTKYAAWRRDAMQMLMVQKVGRVPGPVIVEIQIEDKHARRDADNCIKPTLDILADRRVNVIDGDHSKVVRKVSAEWADVVGLKVSIRRVA